MNGVGEKKKSVFLHSRGFIFVYFLPINDMLFQNKMLISFILKVWLDVMIFKKYLVIFRYLII